MLFKTAIEQEDVVGAQYHKCLLEDGDFPPLALARSEVAHGKGKTPCKASRARWHLIARYGGFDAGEETLGWIWCAENGGAWTFQSFSGSQDTESPWHQWHLSSRASRIVLLRHMFSDLCGRSAWLLSRSIHHFHVCEALYQNLIV